MDRNDVMGGLVILLPVAFAVFTFWTAASDMSGRPHPENMVSGPPGPEELNEQWERIASHIKGVDVGDYVNCSSMILKYERLREMLVESAFVKDDWSKRT